LKILAFKKPPGSPLKILTPLACHLVPENRWIKGSYDETLKRFLVFMTTKREQLKAHSNGSLIVVIKHSENFTTSRRRL
jgi:hypothetical protein